MPAPRFSAPKEWEDWLNIAFGVWLCISPRVLQFTDDTAATQNAIVVGFLIVVAEVLTFSSFAILEVIIDTVFGAWLIASPWILSLTNRDAIYNFIITGALVLLLAFFEFWQGYQGASRRI